MNELVDARLARDGQPRWARYAAQQFEAGWTLHLYAGYGIWRKPGQDSIKLTEQIAHRVAQAFSPQCPERITYHNVAPKTGATQPEPTMPDPHVTLTRNKAYTARELADATGLADHHFRYDEEKLTTRRVPWGHRERVLYLADDALVDACEKRGVAVVIDDELGDETAEQRDASPAGAPLPEVEPTAYAEDAEPLETDVAGNETAQAKADDDQLAESQGDVAATPAGDADATEAPEAHEETVTIQVERPDAAGPEFRLLKVTLWGKPDHVDHVTEAFENLQSCRVRGKQVKDAQREFDEVCTDAVAEAERILATVRRAKRLAFVNRILA